MSANFFKPVVAAPIAGLVRNLNITVTGNTTATIVCNNTSVRIGSDNNTIRTTGVISVTLNASNVGLNGIDAGSLAANTFYNVFAIFNGTTAGVIISTSSPPTLPSGYLWYTRIGYLKTDSSAQFIRTIQRGSKARIIIGGNPTNVIEMASGNKGSGSITAPVYAALDTSAWCPPYTNIKSIDVMAYRKSGTTAMSYFVAPSSSYGGVGGASPPPICLNNSTGTGLAQSGTIYFEGSNNIYLWTDAGAGAAVGILGWEDTAGGN